MSRRHKKTVKDFVCDDLTKEVGKLMDARRRILAPFPVAAEQIYRVAWDQEERAAIRLLAKHRKGILREGLTMIVHLREPLCAISITMQQPVPMPGHTMVVPYDNLTFEQAHALGQWAPLWMDLNEQQATLIERIKEVGRICKTYGQLYRIWPDLHSFYNHAGKSAVNESKVRSAYPAMAYGRDHNDVVGIKEKYRPEAFVPFTSMIAECLMLPENEDREVAKVQRV